MTVLTVLVSLEMRGGKNLRYQKQLKDRIGSVSISLRMENGSNTLLGHFMRTAVVHMFTHSIAERLD